MPELELNHASGRTSCQLTAGLIGDASPWREMISGKALIVTDRTVAGLYLERLASSLAAFAPATLILPPGEESKTIGNWKTILDRLVEIGARRDATVIALGGGVIGDMAGFAAACYMRGIRVVQVPTTLLAQVDASIGGKTGVNLPAGKNLVGAFHQPHAVMIDVTTLKSLGKRDYLAGLAEVIKYGAIRDAAFLDWLEQHRNALLARETRAVEQMVARAVAHKIDVVEADERESGQRALLNFGHTFGHAIETATQYRRYRHGEAVAIGMHLAARLSARIGLLDPGESTRITRLLESFELPIALPDDADADKLVSHMRLDKKNRSGFIRLVLLESAGKAVLRDDIDESTLTEFLNE